MLKVYASSPEKLQLKEAEPEEGGNLYLLPYS